MNGWFQAYSDHPFIPFGTSHLLVILVYMIGMVALYPLAFKPSYAKTIRMTLFLLLFISEVSYQIWAVIQDVWTASYYLPLHLCGIASLIGMWTLLTINKEGIKLNYFYAVVPAAIAILTPDLAYDYQHYRFWKFFLHHMAISWTGWFLYLSSGVKVSWRTLGRAFSWLLLYALCIYFLNQLLGANYLYLSGPPVEGTILNYLGEGWEYIISLVLLAFFVFYLLLLANRLFRQ